MALIYPTSNVMVEGLFQPKITSTQLILHLNLKASSHQKEKKLQGILQFSHLNLNWVTSQRINKKKKKRMADMTMKGILGHLE